MGSIRFVSDLASIKIRNLENKIDKVWTMERYKQVASWLYRLKHNENQNSRSIPYQYVQSDKLVCGA